MLDIIDVAADCSSCQGVPDIHREKVKGLAGDFTPLNLRSHPCFSHLKLRLPFFPFFENSIQCSH